MTSSEIFLTPLLSLLAFPTINIKKQGLSVGPGLAQLVERLAHRYPESTSSNLGNLTSATVCGDRTGSVSGRQEVGKCSTRGGSQGMYITFTSAMQIRQPTLALKPRGDVTRNPKQGYQCPPPQEKDMCMCPPKTLKKKKRFISQLTHARFSREQDRCDFVIIC